MIQEIVQTIVEQARLLKDKHTIEKEAAVNYACIFSQSDKEYRKLDKETAKIGKIVKETKMGNVYLIEPMQTVAGPLRLIKIRKPDPERQERGDADFTVNHYKPFKKEHLDKPGFKLVTRSDMEMIELADKDFDVLAYFSHPTLGEVLSLSL